MRLSGSYNQEQTTYYYELKGNKNLDDYEVSTIYVNGQDTDIDEAKGSFEIGEEAFLDGRGFTVQVAIKADEKLDGNEALELKISNEPKFEASETASATAEIKNFNDCGIDGLVEGIQATGACIDDGNANKAIFAYQVRLSYSHSHHQYKLQSPGFPPPIHQYRNQ